MLTAANKEQPGIPLPATVAAVWGGFLFEGLMALGTDRQHAHEVLEMWNQGCLELVIATTLFLPEVWWQICEVWESSDADFPGVFEYEVISTLGHYLGDYLLANGGRLPDKDVVNAKVADLIATFFSSGVDVIPAA